MEAESETEFEERVISCLPMCKYILRKKRVLARHFDAVLSYAHEGLLLAAKCYRPEYNVPLCSFAYACIERKVKEGMMMTKLPKNRNHAHISYLYFRWCEEQLINGHIPTVAEFKKTIEATYGSRQVDSALGTRIKCRADFGTRSTDIVPQYDDASWDGDIPKFDIRDAALFALRGVPPRTRKIITMHYLESMTLQEIAQVYHISKERVRQIIREGLHHARSFCVKSGLDADDLMG